MQKRNCIFTKSHCGSKENFEFWAACLSYDKVNTKEKYISFPTKEYVFTTLKLLGNEFREIRLKKYTIFTF